MAKDPSSADGSGMHHLTGQEVCEGNNFTEYACLDFPCCGFDEITRLCYSKVSNGPCVSSDHHVGSDSAPEFQAPVAHPLEEPPHRHEISSEWGHDGPPGWSGMPPRGPPPEQLAGKRGKAPWVS